MVESRDGLWNAETVETTVETVGCENLLYTVKAGPAGGRLRRPSSAGNTMDEPSERSDGGRASGAGLGGAVIAREVIGRQDPVAQREMP
jgi:hypothetical protein